MAAFVFDAMSLNEAYQSVLWNNTVAKHLELWYGMRFRIMDDPIRGGELRVILIATHISVKFYSPKSFTSLKVSLELSFSRIMHVHMFQRLFEIFVQTNT